MQMTTVIHLTFFVSYLAATTFSLSCRSFSILDWTQKRCTYLWKKIKHFKSNLRLIVDNHNSCLGQSQKCNCPPLFTLRAHDIFRNLTKKTLNKKVSTLRMKTKFSKTNVFNFATWKQRRIKFTLILNCRESLCASFAVFSWPQKRKTTLLFVKPPIEKILSSQRASPLSSSSSSSSESPPCWVPTSYSCFLNSTIELSRQRMDLKISKPLFKSLATSNEISKVVVWRQYLRIRVSNSSLSILLSSSLEPA